MLDSADGQPTSGIFNNTHIGTETSTDGPIYEEQSMPPGINCDQPSGTISARHLRGRQKNKTSLQQHFEEHQSVPEPSSSTVEVEPSTQSAISATQYHPLSTSNSNNNFEDAFEHTVESKSIEHKRPTNTSLLRHPSLVLDKTLPTPVRSNTVVSNVSPPSGMFYLLDHFKQRLSSMSTYSNVFSLLPQLSTRRERSRSRSAGRRHSSRSRGRSDSSNASLDDEFVFVENIELHHFDGFVFGSRREAAKGHRFEVLHLESPTWCDFCGDFVWGVYKQCLRCKSEYLE